MATFVVEYSCLFHKKNGGFTENGFNMTLFIKVIISQDARIQYFLINLLTGRQAVNHKSLHRLAQK